jgi:mRNA interferase HigB
LHVISPKKLRLFWSIHPDAERPLRAWLSVVEARRYTSPHEVRSDFGGVDFLGAWRTVFIIGGNKYRLIADVRYDLGRIYIQHVLTHAEYDRRTESGTL